MDDINTQNDGNSERWINKDSVTGGVGESRTCTCGDEARCNCIERMRTYNESKTNEPKGDGRNDDRREDNGRNETERERDQVVKVMREIADKIEKGEITVDRAGNQELMHPGKGKNMPRRTGTYVLQVMYRLNEVTK